MRENRFARILAVLVAAATIISVPLTIIQTDSVRIKVAITLIVSALLGLLYLLFGLPLRRAAAKALGYLGAALALVIGLGLVLNVDNWTRPGEPRPLSGTLPDASFGAFPDVSPGIPEPMCPTTSPASRTAIDRPQIVEYPIPTPGTGSSSITLGPDCALWFTEDEVDKIGRVSVDGTMKEFRLSPGAHPANIVVGADQNLWILENRGGADSSLARLTPAGGLTEFPGSGHNIVGIAAGPDGGIWFTEYDFNQIGRMNMTGQVTGEFPIPTPNSGPASIAVGPDGNLWFDEQNAHQIGRITPTGVFSEFRYTGSVVAGTQNNHNPAPGPDGNVWFTDFWNSKIGKVTPDGKVTEYDTPTKHSLPLGIVAGPDGNLWFTECVPDAGRNYCESGSKIGRSTPNGKMVEYPLPIATSGPGGIAVGPDGNIWFIEDPAGKIGKLVIAG